jgi:hypothetical protein
MDPASLAASFVASQMAQFQMAAAAKMIKMNNDASGQAVSELLAAAADSAAKAVTSAANPPGVGQNLDITV